MTATASIETKATEYARKVSENRAVFVYERDGVYWLALRPVDGREGFRTLQAVGFTGCGIRYTREQIATYFEGK